MSDLHRSTQELIHTIEQKDRRFRIFQAISISLIGLGIVALLALNYNIQAQNRDLTRQLTNSVAGLKTDNKTKLDNLQRHIDCIVSLFQQPNRANLVISDITQCKLDLSSSGGAAGSTKSINNAPEKQAPAPNNSSGNQTETSSPTQSASQPSAGTLQRNVLTPIMNLIRGLF